MCDEVYFKMVYPGVEALSFGEITEDVPVIVLSGYDFINVEFRRFSQYLGGCSRGLLSSTSIIFSIR